LGDFLWEKPRLLTTFIHSCIQKPYGGEKNRRVEIGPLNF
jgi:hypothetical protein